MCVNGVVYVWSDLFQSVLSPPFSGMLMKTGSLHPWLGCGHVHDLMGVSPERQEVLKQTVGGSLACLCEAGMQTLSPLLHSSCATFWMWQTF